MRSSHYGKRCKRKRQPHRSRIAEHLEARHLLAGDLVAHWLADDLNDSVADQAAVATWSDRITGALAALERGNPVLAKGQIGGRSFVRFDASNDDGIDSLKIPIAENPINQAADFSVVVAFASDSSLLQGGTGEYFRGTGLVDADTFGLGYDWGIVLNQDAQVGAGVGNGFGTPSTNVYSSASGLNDGQLHVATFTRQADTISLYVDDGAAIVRSGASSQPRSRVDIAFGQLLSGGGGYTGDLAEIRMYNGALDPLEVSDLHETIVDYYGNQPPQTLPDAYTTVEDGFFLGVSVADGILANDSDPDGDPLSAVLIETTQHGELFLQPDGSFIYDSDPDFFGQDHFIYVASDGQSSAPTTVTIDVAPSYDPAVAIADAYKGLSGQVLSISADRGVLSNDQNPDRVPLTAVVVENTPQGHVTLQANGAFDYAPQGFRGTTSFRYRINDGTGVSNTQTVILVINTPPQPADDRFTLQEDTTLQRTAVDGVLQNDVDAESNPMIATLVATTQHGQLSFQSDGSFEYQPDPDYSGPDSFTYRLSDGIDDSASVAVVQLVIESVNDPPVGRDDLYLTFTGRSLDVSASDGVLKNDADVDSAQLTVELASPPRRGSLTLDSSGAFRYVPAAGFDGTDDFRYRVMDEAGASDLVAVTLVVASEDEQIVINEVHYDPPDNTVPAEFIELYHQGFTPVDLSNWYFSSGISYLIPPDTTLQPGEYLVIAQDPATIRRDFGVEAIGPWLGRLSSEGENIELRDNTGDLVDLVDYRQGFPWPTSAGGDGPSIELLHPTLDNSLGGSWRSSIGPTPGVPNSVLTTNAPPQIRQVSHSPQQPASDEPTTVTAKITDPNGVSEVELHYQVVLPGHFLPALLPVPLAELRRRPNTPRPENPEYSDPANWTTIAMVDDGTRGDRVAGDDIYTAVVPGQAHRTLMRYRITAVDLLEDPVTVPYPDDESRNFAYFVYDGVPDYNGHSAESLQTLPVYHLIARAEDVTEMVAYNPRDQIAQGTLARFAYNWPGAFVYNGIVYDNISMRLRGANGRYYLQGKRSMRFRFNDGHYFQAYDQDGEPYPFPWRTLTTGKMFDNRQTLTYGLNEAVNMYLFNQIGVPASETQWVHFRVIDGEEEAPDQWHGDFWGLNFVLETYDIRFLDHHELEHGNLYKLINQTRDPFQQQRYQAPYAVNDGSDHDNIERYLTGSKSAEYIDAHVKLEEWYLYHALSEAIRHYDLWPDANKNMVYYFEPDYRPENNYYGKLWTLPWDTDGTWGPTWNAGHDVVYNSIFPVSPSESGGDMDSTPELWPAYYNTVREIRDLLWQPDQIEPLLWQVAELIKPIEAADLDRWQRGPALTAGNYSGLTGAGRNGIDALVQDMMNFAFVGGNWPGGSVSADGRAAWLDRLQGSRGEDDELPATPTITYVGAANFPADGLRFRSSSFSDPQGNQTFAAMEWRIAEITDPNAPRFDPAEPLKLEWNAEWESGALPTFAGEISPPIAAVQAGHTYRARVRMQDNTGRWSHWSEPVQFTATAAVSSPLVDALRITEIHYHPADPSPTEIAAGFNDADDFEFIELENISSEPIDLMGAQLVRVEVNGQSEGLDFNFADSSIRQLLPGQQIVVVEDLDAFQFRYGTDLPVAGQWQGGLDNGSEQITLRGDGFLIHQFRYDDDWVRVTDGGGPSLELIHPYPNDLSAWGQASSWRASAGPGGTPGTGASSRIPGDSNGDGRFDTADLVLVLQAGEYEDTIPNNSTYEEGDWNGDGDFDTGDLVFALQAGYYEVNPVKAVSVWSRRSSRSLSPDDMEIRDQVFALLVEDDLQLVG